MFWGVVRIVQEEILCIYLEGLFSKGNNMTGRVTDMMFCTFTLPYVFGNVRTIIKI